LSQIGDFYITLVFRCLNFVVFLYYFIYSFKNYAHLRGVESQISFSLYYVPTTKTRHVPLTSFPTGRTAVKSRWILKLKHKVEGLIERYKTRLVAEGFSRHGGADYDQTYPPVVTYDSLWVTLAMAAAEDLQLF
jgi:hypothetical protein